MKETKIWHPELSYIAEDLKIGKGCTVAAMVHIDRDVVIGDNVSIQGMVYMSPGTRIGNNVFLAPQVGFSNDHYPPSKNLLGVTVKDNVQIMFGSKIIGGVIIGEGSIIGMCSNVVCHVPPLQVWYGNPAKFQYSAAEYWKKKRNNP